MMKKYRNNILSKTASYVIFEDFRMMRKYRGAMMKKYRRNFHETARPRTRTGLQRSNKNPSW
jgi:hypothetical protein